jgi:prophage maintenance system killer protein
VGEALRRSARVGGCRPQASAFGTDAYADIHEKAAALLHSLARNHPLVDGNKRLALAGTIAFLGVNGVRLTLTNDEAFDLVVAVASGELDDVGVVAVSCEPEAPSPRARRDRAAAGGPAPARLAARRRRLHRGRRRLHVRGT